MNYDSIAKLYQSGQTVFSVIDLAIIWDIKNNDTLKTKIYYLVKKEKLKRVHQGVFVLNNNYNKYELAGKLKKPSYISLETVFRMEGMVFQYSEEITSVGNLNKIYNKKDYVYSYRKIKDSILYNDEGIIQKDNYAIAVKERALLDMLYLNKNYFFDNLRKIDWEKCRKIVKIYQNKELGKRLLKLEKYAQQK